MSIRVRLALFGLLVVTLTLVVFTAAFYALLTAGGSNTQDRDLADRVEKTVATIGRAAPEEFRDRGGSLAALDPATDTGIFAIVLGPSGEPISSTGVAGGSIPAIPAAVLARADAEGEAVSTVESAGVRLRVRVQPWSRPDLGLSGHVVAAQSTLRVENELRVGRIFLFAAALLAFVVAALAIWLVLGRALRPLKQLASLTNEVGVTQDLARRLPVPGAKDEVRHLSESFNGMMSRLEDAHRQLSEALDSQKRFVADASHELRTPLTTIRSNAGFLMQHPEARQEDRDDALRDIVSESERMSRLIRDLLTLARADGGFQLEKASLPLSRVVRDVARQAGNLHPQLQIRADLTEEVTVHGNEDGLKQLLWILIDNAVRHTSATGRIRLALERHGDRADLIVADDGEGIPEADLPHIFDRFYQVDAARSKGGSGLGLSIARWIVDDHGGQISAHNNDHGGATVRVELPIVESQALPEVDSAGSLQDEDSPETTSGAAVVESPLPKPTA